MSTLRARARTSPVMELLLVVLGFSAITFLFFFPLSAAPGQFAYGRSDNDAHFSIWNVAWVAHALLTDPRHVLDANIFYPHRGTLAYSELNLFAGLVGAPAYWLTRSAYAAHNCAVLASFVMAGTAMYYLCRHLTHDRRASVIGGLLFAFAPYVFAHLRHIQLLMTAGLPLSMLALHRLADRPSPGRGVALGLALTAQTLACQYYAIFVALMVGFGVLSLAALRSLFKKPPFWAALAVAAAVALLTSAPVLLLFVSLAQAGFGRSLDEARTYAANWPAYFASAGLLHEWMLPLIGRWQEVLFPGFMAIALGGAGILAGWRTGGHRRDLALVYAAMAAMAAWASFGPDGGLYRLLYAGIPGVSLIRAPGRIGLIVVFCLSVLSAVGVQALLARSQRRWLLSSVLLMAAAADRIVLLSFNAIPPIAPVYHALAALPDGPVIELPLYSRGLAFARAKYMLDSTSHWKPLVVAYSDHIPDDFDRRLPILAYFPTRDSLREMTRDRVRYAVIHLDLFEGQLRTDVTKRMQTFAPYLRERYRDDHDVLFEIVGAPD